MLQNRTVILFSELSDLGFSACCYPIHCMGCAQRMQLADRRAKLCNAAAAHSTHAHIHQCPL